MNINLIAHKTYSYKAVIYRSGVVLSVADDLGAELLSLQTDEGAPVFAESHQEEGEVVEPKKPMKSSTVTIQRGGKAAAKGADGSGGGKGGTDLKTVTV